MHYGWAREFSDLKKMFTLVSGGLGGPWSLQLYMLFCPWLNHWSKMLVLSLDAMLTLSKTTLPQRLFRYDCITLVYYDLLCVYLHKTLLFCPWFNRTTIDHNILQGRA